MPVTMQSNFHRAAGVAFRTLALSAVAALASMAAAHAAGAPPIKIGLLGSASGPMAAAEIPKLDAVRLAVSEINKSGGLLGRKVDLVFYDTQSSNSRYQQMARRLIGADHVDVIFGGYTSASREAIRPIMDSAKMLYFYNNDYEGGVCDKYTFVTGPVPEQQWSQSIPWMMKKFGNRVYYIGADYNFGQIQEHWVRKYVTENGGTMVGDELIPLSVSQFSQTIQNIQKAKPSFLVAELVGSTQVSFYPQKLAAGLKVPVLSSLAIANEHEQTRFPAPTMAATYVPANFVPVINTPAAQKFVKAMKEAFPKVSFVSQLSANGYNAVNLYAWAVRHAKTTSTDAVIKALESGNACVDGPSGRVCVVPDSHHTSMPIYLIDVDQRNNINVLHQWQTTPTWLRSVGCKLTKKPQFTQYIMGPGGKPVH